MAKCSIESSKSSGKIAMTKQESKYAKMFGCDSARILDLSGKLFLILGEKRNTKQDVTKWLDRDGNVIDLDYLAETVIANGSTESELLASAKEYKRLQGMTMEEYLMECVGK